MKPEIGANFISAVETGSLSMCHQPGSDPRVIAEDVGRDDRWDLEMIADSTST
jgi:hypothetical protein